MARYPLEAKFKNFSGRNEMKRRKAGEFNDVAEAVVAHINTRMAALNRNEKIFEAPYVAKEIGVDEDLVRAVFQTLGGNNGLTVSKS